MADPALGEWDWKTTAGVEVSSGNASSDTGSWVGVAQIGIATLDRNGVNRAGMLGGIVVGQEILIWRSIDSSIWSRWRVGVAGVDNGTYWVFGVSFLEGAGAPSVTTFSIYFELGEPVPPEAPEGFRWVERWPQLVGGGDTGECWVIADDLSLLRWTGTVWEEIDKVPPTLVANPPVAPVEASVSRVRGRGPGGREMKVLEWVRAHRQGIPPKVRSNLPANGGQQ